MWTPKFFHCGVDSKGAAMPGQRCGECHRRPDEGRIDHPGKELRLIIVDGKAANKAALVSVAKSLAQPYLKNLGSPTRIVTARGFARAECSGLVREIRWDQRAVHTQLKLNDWFAPSGAPIGHKELRRARSRRRRRPGRRGRRRGLSQPGDCREQARGSGGERSDSAQRATAADLAAAAETSPPIALWLSTTRSPRSVAAELVAIFPANTRSAAFKKATPRGWCRATRKMRPCRIPTTPAR